LHLYLSQRQLRLSRLQPVLVGASQQIGQGLLRAPEILLSGQHLLLGGRRGQLGERGFGCQQVGLGRRQIRRIDPFSQRRQVELRLAQVDLRLGYLVLLGRVVQAGQHLPGLHLIANFDQHLGQCATAAESQSDLGGRDQCP